MAKTDIINENRESKNINLARKYLMTTGGMSQEQAQKVLDGIRHDIPSSRLAECKFLLGVVRMFLKGQLDDANTIMKINQTLKYVAGNAHVNEYDYNLNNMTANDLITRFSRIVSDDIAQQKQQSINGTYTQNDDYSIVKIPDFETASRYADYVTWCVTQDESAYDSYTNNGLGLFYFCLKNGFENVKETPGENAPLDEYGLSMIAVSVNEDGSPNTITCRWNHAEGGNDSIMSPQQLEQVIGRSFYNTFLPYSEEEIAKKRQAVVDEAMECFLDTCDSWYGIDRMIDDGSVIPLFDVDDEDYDGEKYFAYKYESDYTDNPKCIIINGDGELAVNDFYDDVDYCNYLVLLTKGRKTSFMPVDYYGKPRVVTDKWYRKVIFSSPSYVTVMNDDKLFNIVYTINGKEVLENWVKACDVYYTGARKGRDTIAIILGDDGYNIIPLHESIRMKPLFDEPKFEISVVSGEFIKVVDKQPQRGYREPFELYAFNLEKFPYPVYSCDGHTSLSDYKVSCENGYVVFDINTADGFKIKEIVPYQNNEGNNMSGQPNQTQKAAMEENKASKTVILDEDTAREMKDMLTMTQFKFKANIRKFLAALLEDPTGAEPGMIFKYNGLDKNKLIKALVDNKVITKKMTIDDHDVDGKPHTARMIVKYSVPKERFNERLDALYDVLFPDVEAKINEEGGGATSCSGVDGNGFGSGEFTVPFGGITVRKNKKYDKKVGGNPYCLTEGKKVVRLSEAQARLVREAVTGEDGRKSSAVYAYARNADGEWCILAAKRNKNLDDDEGGKMNPPMGHRHKYESPEDGAVRECEEESGIKFDKKDLVLASKEDWGTNFKIWLPGKTTDYKPGDGDGENTKFRWIPVSKIDDYNWAWSCGSFAKRFKPRKSMNEGKSYVNMDVELRNGGRNAVKMSVEDFKKEMAHAYHMYAMEQGKKHKSELKLTPTEDSFVYALCYNTTANEKSKYTTKLNKDIWGGKYKFDSENVDAIGGIKMSSKGFPYIMCYAGGDWECPVCFFVYFDGTHFRGYVPLKGNVINRDTNNALDGGRNEEDDKFIAKEMGIDYEEAARKHDSIDFNKEACLEDFLARVEVKGTYKKRDFTEDEEKFKRYRDEKVAEQKRRNEEIEKKRQENEKKYELDSQETESEDEITEATATGSGGLPGEFTVPFPIDKDDPSMDRTPGNTIGMHDRVGKSNLEEKKKKKGKDFWEKHGIKRQKICQSGNVDSIGFSETEQKWYGWSHRAIYGFGIGSKVKKGDCAYNGKEWTAKTLDDAKRMAIDFARNVS